MLRKIMFSVTLLTLLACVLAGTAYAEAEKKSQGKTSKYKIDNENPFDSSSNLFSTKNRNNEVNIYYALVNMAAKFTKSEYESSDAYVSRIDKICEKTVAGKLKFCDTLGFLSRSGIKYEYDADAQKMAIYVPIKREAIDTLSTIIGKKKYTATNAYGAKARVSATEYSSFAVEMRRDETIATNNNDGSETKPKIKKAGPSRRNLILYVSMNPEEAKVLKSSGGVLITGKLSKPFIDNYTWRSEPTISEPTETINHYHYVVIDPAEIWVVNTKTGKIWSKEKFVTSEDTYVLTTIPLNSPSER